MINQTFADYLNKRGYKANYPKPKEGETFVRGTVIEINNVKYITKELNNSPYKGVHQSYLGRLKE